MARLEDEVGELAKEFVCVRAVEMRGVDTSVFQFDFDLTWCAFFMNPDLTIYGRYGSRVDKGDALYMVSGFVSSMKRALELHKAWPANRSALLSKNGKDYSWKTPERSPALTPQFRATQEFPKACVHCHHVWKAVRRSMWMDKKATPEPLLYVYPMPDAIGMTLDPKDGVTVSAVADGSIAFRGGVRTGDVVDAVNGQPVISTADVQWILQNAPDAGALKLEVTRGGGKKTLALTLAGPWRRNADFSWRTSTGDLRLGMVMEPLDDAARRGAGLRAGGLKVKNAAPKGPAVAAGFAIGDVIVAFNGQPVPGTEAEFLALLRTKLLPGTKLKLTVVRGGKRQDISMDLP